MELCNFLGDLRDLGIVFIRKPMLVIKHLLSKLLIAGVVYPQQKLTAATHIGIEHFEHPTGII
jgi:hypothetical protein